MTCTDRAQWAGDSDANFGLPSPPAMGGDDPSFFSSAPMPTPGGGGEEQFVPSKMGYLHIKNQVQNHYSCELRVRNQAQRFKNEAL